MEKALLKALFEPTRFGLLQMIAERGYCVKALAAKSGLSEACVCQHMKILLDVGLVIRVKRGYYTHYCLCKERFGEVIAELDRTMEKERESCCRGRSECDVKSTVKCRAYTKEVENA